MLHLLNGDAIAAEFARAGLPGDVAVWRDILMEGPVATGPIAPAAMPGRVAYLAERLAIAPERYRQVSDEEEALLARAARHDELVLWFEQDLFCAVNLWFVLARLAHGRPPRVSLVLPGTHLGAMSAADLGALFRARRALDEEAIAAGRAAWLAYAGADPRAVQRLLGAGPGLPFVAGAARRHLGRFPSVGDGLNEQERAVLRALAEGPLAFAALFARVAADPAVRPLGAGDVQLAGLLREMQAGPAPLVSVAGAGRSAGEWTVAATESGRSVLGGRADRMACSPVDRWLGGVRLEPGRGPWRWDGRQLHAPAAP